MGNIELVFGIIDELQIKMPVFGFVKTEPKIWECKNEKQLWYPHSQLELIHLYRRGADAGLWVNLMQCHFCFVECCLHLLPVIKQVKAHSPVISLGKT